MAKRYRQSGRQRKLRWIAIDTEGANHPDGYQYTHVLSANGPNHVKAPLVGKSAPLSTKAMLKWICELPKGFKLVGYFFKYDQNMILWQLPEESLRILFGVETFDESAEMRIVEYEGYWISRFSTLLEICKPRDPDEPLPTTRDEFKRVKCWVRKEIWDAGKFFQCSFLQACINWNVGTEKELALLKTWKEQRNAFTFEFFQKNSLEISRYTMLENELLCQLFAKLNDVCDANGYVLNNWYSPGSIAKVMLKKHGVKDRLAEMPPKSERFWDACDWAYFGGRFEIKKPGLINKPLYEYDINSAYPYAMLSLPCIECSEWRASFSRQVKSPHSLVKVRWESLAIGDHTYGPFPVRDKKGVVLYPLAFQGWYWGHEVLAAFEHMPQFTYIVEEQYEFVQHCSHELFDWVDAEYKRRQAIGKDTKGIPIKLGLNSLYGSIASPLSPKYCNAIYAGMITSKTRAMLIEAMGLTKPANVVMFATDAIVTTDRLDLSTGNDLGQWEETDVLAGSLIIQPGVYIFPEEDKMKIKTRGVSLDWVKKHKQLFYDAWELEGECGTVMVDGICPECKAATIECPHMRMQFIGWGQAFHRNNPALARTWVPAEKAIGFGTPKRIDGKPAPVKGGDERPHGKFGNIKVLTEQDDAAFVQALVTGEQPSPMSSPDLDD